MKKFLIIFLVLLLSIVGCSNNDIPSTSDPDEIAEENQNGQEPQEEEPQAEDPIGEDAQAEDIQAEDAESQNVSGGNPQVEDSEAKEGEDNFEKAPGVNDQIPAEEGKEPTDTTEQIESSDSVDTGKSGEEAADILKIEGLVGKELKLSFDELKKMADYIFEDDYYSLNSFGTTGYTHFKGINLWYLLEKEALIEAEAGKIRVIAKDGYEVELTIDGVKKQDYIDETNPDKKFPIIIAWEENGEEYDADLLAPYKLVVGQTEAGDVNKPQWVYNIDRIIVE